MNGDTPYAVQYRTTYAVEVVIPFPPGTGISGEQMSAAQQQLERFVEASGGTVHPDDYRLTVIEQGRAALSAAVLVECGRDEPASVLAMRRERVSERDEGRAGG